MGYKYDVFISYRRDQIPYEWTHEVFLPQFTHWLGTVLPKKPEIFVDKKNIYGGANWEKTIITALATSKVLVPILLPDYFRQDWCIREFGIMRHRQNMLKLPDQRLILPFIVADHELFPVDVQNIQGYHCHKYYRTGKAFKDNKRFVKFQDKMANWIPEIASAIVNTPPWSPEWLDEKFLKIDCEHLRIGIEKDLDEDILYPIPEFDIT